MLFIITVHFISSYLISIHSHFNVILLLKDFTAASASCCNFIWDVNSAPSPAVHLSPPVGVCVCLCVGHKKVKKPLNTQARQVGSKQAGKASCRCRDRIINCASSVNCETRLQSKWSPPASLPLCLSVCLCNCLPRLPVFPSVCLCVCLRLQLSSLLNSKPQARSTNRSRSRSRRSWSNCSNQSGCNAQFDGFFRRQLK